MKTQSTSEQTSQMEEDRREEVRKYLSQPSRKIYLWVTIDKKIEAYVVDLCQGGLAVAVDSDWHFDAGFQVRVAFSKTKYTANIQYVTAMDDGRRRIGLMWER